MRLRHLTPRVFSRTTPSSVLGLVFEGLTASPPAVPVLSSFPGDSRLLHRGAGGEDVEQLSCSFLILMEIILSSWSKPFFGQSDRSGKYGGRFLPLVQALPRSSGSLPDASPHLLQARKS